MLARVPDSVSIEDGTGWVTFSDTVTEPTVDRMMLLLEKALLIVKVMSVLAARVPKEFADEID